MTPNDDLITEGVLPSVVMATRGVEKGGGCLLGIGREEGRRGWVRGGGCGSDAGGGGCGSDAGVGGR